MRNSGNEGDSDWWKWGSELSKWKEGHEPGLRRQDIPSVNRLGRVWNARMMELEPLQEGAGRDWKCLGGGFHV